MALTTISLMLLEESSSDRLIVYEILVDTLRETSTKFIDSNELKTLLPIINGDLLSNDEELRVGAFQAANTILTLSSEEGIVTKLSNLRDVLKTGLPAIERADCYSSCVEIYLKYLASEGNLEGLLREMTEAEHVTKMRKHIEKICKEDKALGAEVFVHQILPNAFSSPSKVQNIFLELAFNLIDDLPIDLLPKEKIVQFKGDAIKSYIPKIVEIRADHQPVWSKLWILLVKYLRSHMHKKLELTNSILRVVEPAFRSARDQIVSYDCWKVLIDSYNLDRSLITANKHIKLLTTPLKAKLSKTEPVMAKRMEVWTYLLKVLKDASIKCLDLFLIFSLSSIGHDKESNLSNCCKRPELFNPILELVTEMLGHSHHNGSCLTGLMERSFLLEKPVITFANLNKHGICATLTTNFIIEVSELVEMSGTIQQKDKIINCMWASFFKNMAEIPTELLVPPINACLDVAKASKGYKFVVSIFSELLGSDLRDKVFEEHLFELLLENLSTIPELSEILKKFVNISFKKCDNKTFLKVLPKYFGGNCWKNNPEVSAELWLKSAELIMQDQNTNPSEISKEDMLSLMLVPSFLLHALSKEKEKHILEQWTKLQKSQSQYTECLADSLRITLKDNPNAVVSTCKLLFVLLANNDKLRTFNLVNQLLIISADLLELPNFTHVSSIVDVIKSFMNDCKGIKGDEKIQSVNQYLNTTLKKFPKKASDVLSNLLNDPKSTELNRKSDPLQEISTKQSSFTRSSKLLEMAKNTSVSPKMNVRGSMLGTPKKRDSKTSPHPKRKLDIMDEKSSDFVVIDSEPKLVPEKMSSHQKEVMCKRRDDIPPLYQDLTQDTQDFDKASENLSDIERVIGVSVKSVKESPVGKALEKLASSSGLEKRSFSEAKITNEAQSNVSCETNGVKKSTEEVVGISKQITGNEKKRSPRREPETPSPIPKSKRNRRKSINSPITDLKPTDSESIVDTIKQPADGCSSKAIEFNGNTTCSESLSQNGLTKSPIKETSILSPVKLNNNRYKTLCPKEVVIKIRSPIKPNGQSLSDAFKDGSVVEISKFVPENQNDLVLDSNTMDINTALTPTVEDAKSTNDAYSDKKRTKSRLSQKKESLNKPIDTSPAEPVEKLNESVKETIEKSMDGNSEVEALTERQIRKRQLFRERELSRLKMNIKDSEQFLTKSRMRNSIPRRVIYSPGSDNCFTDQLQPKKSPRKVKSDTTNKRSPIQVQNKPERNQIKATRQESLSTNNSIHSQENITTKQMNNSNVTHKSLIQSTLADNKQTASNSQEILPTPLTIPSESSQTNSKDPKAKTERRTSKRQRRASLSQAEITGGIKSKRRNSWTVATENASIAIDIFEQWMEKQRNEDNLKESGEKMSVSDSAEMVESSQESFTYIAPVQNNSTIAGKSGRAAEVAGTAKENEEQVAVSTETVSAPPGNKNNEDLNETLTCDPYAFESEEGAILPLRERNPKETNVLLPKGTSPVKEQYKLFTNCFESPTTKLKEKNTSGNFYLEKEHFPSLEIADENNEVVLIEIVSDSEDIFPTTEEPKQELNKANIENPNNEPEKTKDDISSSPVTIHTPTKTKELLNDTIDISPIKSVEPETASKSAFENWNYETAEASPPEGANTEETNPPCTPSNRSSRLLFLMNKPVPSSGVAQNDRPVASVSSPQTARAKKMMANLSELRGEEDKSSPEVTDGRLIYTETPTEILTFARELPSPFATPRGGSILKRKLDDRDSFTGDGLPCPKRKKVNFSDPPTTCQRLYFPGVEDENDVMVTKKGKKKHGKRVNTAKGTNEEKSKFLNQEIAIFNSIESERMVIPSFTDTPSTSYTEPLTNGYLPEVEHTRVQNGSINQIDRFQVFKDYLMDLKKNNDEAGLEAALDCIGDCFSLNSLLRLCMKKAGQQ